MPAFLNRTIIIRKEMKKLQLIQELKCDAANLPPVSGVDPKAVFSSCEVEMRWDDSKSRLDMFPIPDSTGGVNPGDRRAIYYLINRFRPSSVLEIGTHIGASTLHITEALFVNQRKDTSHAEFVSVDVADVNDPISKPWLQYGATH